MSANLVIKPSIIMDSLGGDIDEYTFLGINGVDISLNSEESFFASEITKGFYVKNVSPSDKNIKLENITIYVQGVKLEEELTSSDALDKYVALMDSEFEEEIRDMFGDEYQNHTFLTYFNERRMLNVPPYNPNNAEMEFYSTDGDAELEFEAFSKWFKDNAILAARNRTSLFGQLDVGINVPQVRILHPVSDIEEFGYIMDYSKQSFIPTLYRGDYWGFFLNIQMDFVPDWLIEKDFAYVYLQWDEVEFDFEESKEVERSRTTMTGSPLRIKVSAILEDINKLVVQATDKMYANYPPYFAYYNEE